MLDPHFVFLGFAMNIIGEFTYIADTVKGKTKPNRVSWFLFALAPLIALSAQIHEGVGIQALQTFVVGFGPALIFIASFANRQSVWKITKFDVFCGCISLLALLSWLLTRHSSVAIAFSILADASAALPTVRKAWKDPHSEASFTFLMAAIGAIITLLTIKHLTFINAGFAIYIFIICALLFTLIRFKIGIRMTRKGTI